MKENPKVEEDEDEVGEEGMETNIRKLVLWKLDRGEYNTLLPTCSHTGKVDAQEAEELFDQLGVKLSLTMAYNLEANRKVERRHGPILKAIVRACNERVGNWLRLLPYALWADRTTHSSVTEYVPAELMFGQKPIMSVEWTIASWMEIDWANKMNREELLVIRIRQLERRPGNMERAKAKLHEAREKNKEWFDRTHGQRPRKLEEGDWILVYDNSLDNQHQLTRKFARLWFGLYVVTSANDNAMYHLVELNGTRIPVPIAGIRINPFKK